MHGSSWTGPLVRERLEVAFRSISSAGVYSPGTSRFARATGDIDGLELIAAAHHVLGRQAPDTIKLLTYCRNRAIGRAAGVSWSGVCRELGWDRKRAREVAIAASERLAAELNRIAAGPEPAAGLAIAPTGVP